MYTCQCGFIKTNFKSKYKPSNICPRCHTEIDDQSRSFIPTYGNSDTICYSNNIEIVSRTTFSSSSPTSTFYSDYYKKSKSIR